MNLRRFDLFTQKHLKFSLLLGKANQQYLSSLIYSSLIPSPSSQTYWKPSWRKTSLARYPLNQTFWAPSPLICQVLSSQQFSLSIFFFFGCAHPRHTQIPRPGIHLHHSSNHNGSLTHWATRELPGLPFLTKLLQQMQVSGHVFPSCSLQQAPLSKNKTVPSRVSLLFTQDIQSCPLQSFQTLEALLTSWLPF